MKITDQHKHGSEAFGNPLTQAITTAKKFRYITSVFLSHVPALFVHQLADAQPPSDAPSHVPMPGSDVAQSCAAFQAIQYESSYLFPTA